MFFDSVSEAPPDPIFGINLAFDQDLRKDKVNLTVGVYKDESLQAELMPSVRKGKEKAFSDDLLADYLPIEGLHSFCNALGFLLFGKDGWQSHHGRIAVAQCIGGTGALRLAGQFLVQEVGKQIAIPDPTWPNHLAVFQRSGMDVLTYPYYDKELHQLSFESLCSSIQKMEKKSSLLLHPVCHNPTGVDLKTDQWRELFEILLKKEILPVFDFAYHGFGDGLDQDRSPIEMFLQTGREMVIAYSCSKNFSLYCQRVGALFVVASNPAAKLRVQSQLQKLIRSLYSNPPAHGAKVVL